MQFPEQHCLFSVHAALSETHVAVARMALSSGRTSEAVVALRRALDLAPTFFPALELLGGLECKAGHNARGVERLRLAADLQPARFGPRVLLAREHAFAGDAAAVEREFASLGDVALVAPALIMRLRIAAWLGDDVGLRTWFARSTGLTDQAQRTFYVEMIGRGLLGEATWDEIEGYLRPIMESPKDPRLHADTGSMAVDMALRMGRTPDALAYLQRLAAMDAFVDADWLRRCPLLASVRGTNEYDNALRSACVHAQSLSW